MQQGTAHPLSEGNACRRLMFCGRRIRSRCAGGEAPQQIALQAQLRATTVSLPVYVAAILVQIEQSSSRSNVPCNSLASNRAYKHTHDDVETACHPVAMLCVSGADFVGLVFEKAGSELASSIEQSPCFFRA